MKRKILGISAVIAALAMANAASASADALYVDNSGADTGDCTVPATPCQTIEYAHDRPGLADVIHLGGGSYAESAAVTGSESLIEDSTFSAAAAGAAVIDNSVLVGDATLAALTLASTGTVSGLTIVSDYRGVTITAAGTLSGNSFAFDAPSGTYNADVVVESFATGSPAISGNSFIDPNPESAAPGQVAVVLNSPGSPTVSGNTFTGFHQAINALSGGPGTPSPMISDNVITGTHDASATGTAILASGVIQPTLVANNVHSPGAGSPGGIFIGSAGATLRRNRVIGHEVGLRVSNTTAPVTLSSDLIAKSASGGINVQGIGATVNATNVTVVDSAPASDVIVGNQTNLTLDSSIIGAGSSPPGIDQQGSGACTISFSRGTGDAAGNCDVGFVSTANPIFANPAGGDYHLTAGSPMIDAGDTADPVGLFDIDGDARALAVAAQCTTPPAGRRDIGADEFVTTCPPPPTPPAATPPAAKKCKKGQKLKKGKCVKAKLKRKRN